MPEQGVSIHSQEVALEGHVTGAEERFVNFIENVRWKFQFVGEDLSSEEVSKLAEKLDRLGDEPTVSFSSSRDAVDYLRSIARCK